jgi:hypothetical protein
MVLRDGTQGVERRGAFGQWRGAAGLLAWPSEGGLGLEWFEEVLCGAERGDRIPLK